MLKIKSLLARALCAAVVCVSLTSVVSAVTVTFPDANLEAKVRSRLGIPAPTPITDTDMETMGLFYGGMSNISNIQGLEYGTNLTTLWLGGNQISDISAVAGLTNLEYLYLKSNQIVTMNLSDSNLSSLKYFDIAGNPLTSVLLTNATLSQSVFDVLMNEGWSNRTGIAELAGVLSLAMDGVDFAGISDLSKMYTMDDLETLLLAGASNLDGADVVTLTGELDSLNWLDVTGLWDGFDQGSQGSLNAWDNIAGNTLVTPEPATMSLLAIGALALLRQRRRRK